MKSNIVQEAAPAKKPRISESLIEDMLAAANMVEVVENEYGLVLTPQPNGWYKTTCPMPDHRDDSPSFFIQPEKNFFNCFGCGARGNLIEFMRRVDGISFPEAIQRLSVYSGIDMANGETDVLRAIRDIKHMVNEYINRQGETNLPGGMSEFAFLMMVAQRMRKHEQKTDGDDNELDWIERVYTEIDDLMMHADHKGVRKVWSKLSTELPQRLVSFRAEHPTE